MAVLPIEITNIVEGNEFPSPRGIMCPVTFDATHGGVTITGIYMETPLQPPSSEMRFVKAFSEFNQDRLPLPE